MKAAFALFVFQVKAFFGGDLVASELARFDQISNNLSKGIEFNRTEITKKAVEISKLNSEIATKESQNKKASKIIDKISELLRIE